MIQPPARFGEGESAGRRPGGSAEAGFARLPALRAGGLRPDPASSANRKIPPKLNQPPPPARGEKLLC